MLDPPLLGDGDGLDMACPAGAAADMAAQLTAMSPSGPVLELCCGVGGLTRELARAGRRVLAVDKSQARLKANQVNLAALGLTSRVSHLCCDLQNTALRAPQSRLPFAAAVLDPNWSPPGAPPEKWTSSLSDMEPPADDLIGLALSLSPLIVIRLPRDVAIGSAGYPAEGLATKELGQGGKGWRWLALHRA